MSRDPALSRIPWDDVLRTVGSAPPDTTWQGRASARVLAGVRGRIARPRVRLAYGRAALLAASMAGVAILLYPRRGTEPVLPPTPLATQAPEAGPEEPLPIRISKAEAGSVRLEWEGPAGARYRISRCFIRPGLEACEEIDTAQGTTWTDEGPRPAFADLVLYRVSPVTGRG